MTTQQPEALPALIERFRGLHFDHAPDGWPAVRTREITALLDRITELESQLAQRFDAADMATAAAQGFMDGVASVSAGSEPVAVVGSDFTLYWAGTGPIAPIVEKHGIKVGSPLYTHPYPKEGMAGRLQVYRCKIKSKKQIDKEIPREQQGWWADVAAGQKLLLRQAVQSDLDRCTLCGKRSRNPADYMCETENDGSLVSKVALEYMNPEQNVFAAAPGPADGEINELC